MQGCPIVGKYGVGKGKAAAGIFLVQIRGSRSGQVDQKRAFTFSGSQQLWVSNVCSGFQRPISCLGWGPVGMMMMWEGSKVCS